MKEIVWHTAANLLNLIADAVTETLRFGCENDAVRQPVIRLFPPPLRTTDAKLSLKLLDEPVLGRVFVYDDRSHLSAQVTVSIHGVHIGGLFSAFYH